MTGFVFVHGAWHNQNTWDEITSRLRKNGHVAMALDLPGAGQNARSPASFSNRPLDPTAFEIEPSPNASVTQEERTDAVIAAIRAVNAQAGGEAILVGHSLGGLTLSQVTEAIPDEISAVVYITAFLLPPGMPGIAMIQHPLMERAMVPGLLQADPEQVGALRIDTASDDPDYRSRVKECFYGDVDTATFDRMAEGFHCDEPIGVCLVPSPVTAENFGRVPRHYVECTQDNAITIEAQREMINFVDATIGGATKVHSFDTSHSPFSAKPDELAALLDGIGR